MLFGGLIMAMFTGGGPLALTVAWIGLALFSTAFVFALITLPVRVRRQPSGHPNDGERVRHQRH